MKKIIAFSDIFILNFSISCILISGMQEYRQSFAIVLLKAVFFFTDPLIRYFTDVQSKKINE